MAINLHINYSTKLADKFARDSFIDGRLSNEWNWRGVSTVAISTLLTVPMNDYTRSGFNRYGTPVEMQDTVQELPVTQDKSYSLTIDKGNYTEQQEIKKAGRVIGLQIKEQGIPMKDTYCFGVLATKGGTIVGNATALSKSNIVERIGLGAASLDDAEAPEDDRTLYVPASVYNLIRLSPEFVGIESLGKKSIGRGMVGEIFGMDVVKVPTSRWPANVNFMIVHKSAAVAPVKIYDNKLHRDPPGLNGNLIEGRMRYDCFVIGARASGIYVEVNTASGAGTVLAAPTIAGTGAITAASGATVMYTTDGSDPRYSKSAKIGTTVTGVSGTVVKAYAYKDGSFPSAVATATLQ